MNKKANESVLEEGSNEGAVQTENLKGMFDKGLAIMEEKIAEAEIEFQKFLSIPVTKS